MSVYPDASFLVSLFAVDAMTPRARSFLHTQKPELIIGDFAAAEFASAISRRVRMGDLTKDQGRRALSGFDIWTARFGERAKLETTDIAAAEAYLRRLDLTLRTPDAIHIAVSERLGTHLATFDAKMASAARQLKASLAAV